MAAYMTQQTIMATVKTIARIRGASDPNANDICLSNVCEMSQRQSEEHSMTKLPVMKQ